MRCAARGRMARSFCPAPLEDAKPSLEAFTNAAHTFPEAFDRLAMFARRGTAGQTDLVELLEPEGLTPKQSQYVRAIRDSGASLLQLIHDILDLSKLEAGKLELHPEPTDMRDSCEFLRTVFGQQAVNETRAFAHKLFLLGQTAQCGPLATYAATLTTFADAYAIGQMERHLAAFPKLVESIETSLAQTQPQPV